MLLGQIADKYKRADDENVSAGLPGDTEMSL